MYTLEVGKKRRCQVMRNELPLYPTPHDWVSISLPHTVSEADGTRKEHPPSSSNQVLPVGTQSWAQGRQQAGACAAGDGRGELDV